jgi:hypothetical protein
MNWTKTSAIAEIVSSVAILLTLAYLAVQTQQNTAALVASSRQQSLDSELAYIRMNLEYPEFSVGIATDPDEVRQESISAALFRIREHQWFQLQDGQLDEDSFRSYLQVLVDNLQDNQDLRERWDEWATRGIFDPEFAAAVDNELTRGLTPQQ